MCLSLVEDNALIVRIVDMLSKQNDFRSARPKSIKATHHTLFLKVGTRSISQQLYRARRRSLEVLCGHLYEKLEAGVVKPARP